HKIVIVTVPEKTPYYECKRLVAEFNCANTFHHWWVVNQALVTLNQRDDLCRNKKEDQSFWINKIKNECLDNYFVIPYRVLEY
ncbi:arsenical pump-driving ATPase, partial [Staphylococcus epidermidis]